MMRPGWNKFHPNCSDCTCQARPGRCIALGLHGSAPRDKGQQQDHYMLHRSPIHQKFHTNRPPRMIEELLDPLYLFSLLMGKQDGMLLSCNAKQLDIINKRLYFKIGKHRRNLQPNFVRLLLIEPAREGHEWRQGQLDLLFQHTAAQQCNGE